ncbi:unnamed protein product [Adineta ricciae]|uniref:Uncharacterized protein n=1 Tax=Adineta ricciae TaxID=249248 RepID=A0A814KYB1_ADIRI|nr:unnamed protein product [Adineta ricciae]CAF1056079.1 unnamed protein product [Adineta ricciae]
MKEFLLICIIVGILGTEIWARPENSIDDLDHETASNFLKRTLFHPGKTRCEEQKREAAEKYEERCEPSINKLTGSRYCPDIQTWEAFQIYEVGSGYGR